MYPILFKAGGFAIYSYGFFLTLAYLGATFIVWREGKKRGFNEEKLLDLSLLALIAALVGGRIFYVALNWAYFSADLKSILYLWQGGFAYFGALVLGTFVVWYFSKAWKWPFFQIADITALASALAFSVGKFGAFLAGTDYGIQTSLPWGINFPNLVGSRHPVQIYEAAASLIIFVLLSRIYVKNTEKSGEISSGVVFFYWLILSGLARFFLEFFRADSTPLAGVKLAQILALVVASCGLVSMYYFNLRNFRVDLRVFLKKISSIDLKLAKLKLTRR